MYFLKLQKFQNLGIILTTKYLIFINHNGLVSLKTNFFNLFIKDNNLYINLRYYNTINNNLYLYFLNKNILSFYSSTKLLNYSLNYLNSLYNTIYYLNFNYTTNITLKGIGYKFTLEPNNILRIRVGYSHFITYKVDNNVYLNLKSPTVLTLYSNNKFLINKCISAIKLCKKTNLYKGTGIFYDNEFITLKKKNNNKNKNVK